MRLSELVDLALHDRRQLVERAKRSNVARRIEDGLHFARGRRFAETNVNSLEIGVLGMRRSGNHAVIQWLQALDGAGPGEVVFLNNLVPGDNGYRHRLWFPEDATAHEMPIYRAGRRKTLGEGSVALLLRSYEDISLASFEREFVNPFHYGGSVRRVKCLIYRDPANLFASRLRSGYVETQELDQRALYLEHTAGIGQREDILYIDYNRFIADAAYRAGLAKTLGLRDASGDVLERMTSYGGGSSFGDTRVEAEKLTSRYVSMLEDGAFRRLIEDPEIVDRFAALFPEDYRTLQSRLSAA